MITDNVKATGALLVTLYSDNGIVKEQRKVTNLVVTTGKEYIASRLVTTGLPSEMSHMSVGDDNTSAVAGDTTLTSELGRTALASIGDSDNTVSFSATFLPGTGTGALKEAGIFNDSAAGTMLCRTIFGEVNKGVGDTLTIDWTVTIN